MLIPCLASVQLPDASPHFAVSPDGRWLAVWGGRGEVTILSDTLEVAARLQVAGSNCSDIAQMALSPDGNLLAVLSRQEATVFTRQGQVQARQTWSSGLHDGGGGGCVFSGDGRLLWVAEKPGLMVLDVQTNRVLASHPLDFVHRLSGSCSFLLDLHPEGEVAAVWAANGPDAPTQLFWSRFANDRLEIYQRPSLQRVGTPAFRPSGSEFLTLPTDGSLVRYRFPDCEIIGQLYEEDVFEVVDDEVQDQFSCETFYISDTRALVDTNEEVKTLLINVSTMRMLEEVEFEGCSPNRQPLLAAFHPPNHLWTTNSDYRDKKRTIQLWDAQKLVGPTSQPDPARLLTAQLVSIGELLS